MAQKNKTAGIVNPFSENFELTWDLWKAYRLEQHKFQYKGVISEQMALKHLVELSDGQEEKAIKIVEQSIRRQWQGFFPLHETTHGNGTKQTNPKNGFKPAISRDAVNSEANKRYGGGKQAGSSTNT